MGCSTLAVVALAALACGAAAVSDYDSMKCLAYGQGCDQRLSDRADNWCEPHRHAHEQDPCCKKVACAYCMHHRHEWYCNWDSIKSQCFQWYGQATSWVCKNGQNHHHGHGNGHGYGYGNGHGNGHGYGHNQNNHNKGHHHGNHYGHNHHGGYKAPAPSSHGGCIWRQGYGKHSVIINPSGWASGNWRESGDSITYKPWDYNGHHIDGQGSSTISFKFTVREAGEYRLTAKTYAPHNTEYNDMWMRFQGGQNLKIAKHGHTYYQGGWLKCYQNSYTSYDLFTKDHDPHSLVTPHLNPGQVYTVDISGRSTRFKVERLIIKNTHHYHDHDMTVSQCY